MEAVLEGEAPGVRAAVGVLEVVRLGLGVGERGMHGAVLCLVALLKQFSTPNRLVTGSSR